MSKAILINVVAKTLTQVEINGLDDIYQAIGNDCSLFTCPFQLENNDTFYVDDEGLLKEVFGGVQVEGYHSPFVGNVVLIGSSEDGDNMDVRTSIKKLLPMLTFMNPNQAKLWQVFSMSTPPQFFKF
jgi:hypothetical protein